MNCTPFVRQCGILSNERGVCYAQSGSKCRPRKLPKKIEEDVLAEVQRLRAENEYLKNLQALVLEDERRQRKERR